MAHEVEFSLEGDTSLFFYTVDGMCTDVLEV